MCAYHDIKVWLAVSFPVLMLNLQNFMLNNVQKIIGAAVLNTSGMNERK